MYLEARISNEPMLQQKYQNSPYVFKSEVNSRIKKDEWINYYFESVIFNKSFDLIHKFRLNGPA